MSRPRRSFAGYAKTVKEHSEELHKIWLLEEKLKEKKTKDKRKIREKIQYFWNVGSATYPRSASEAASKISEILNLINKKKIIVNNIGFGTNSIFGRLTYEPFFIAKKNRRC